MSIEKITIRFKSLESIVVRKDFYKIIDGFVQFLVSPNDILVIPLKFFVDDTIDNSKEYFSIIDEASYAYIINGKQSYIQNKHVSVFNSLIEESSKKLKDPIFINGYETRYSDETKILTICGYKITEADIKKLLLLIFEKRPDLIKSLRPKQRG